MGYGGIWDEYKEEKFHTAAFEMVVCLKKLFYAIALVALQYKPALQVSLIVAVSIAYYILVLLWEPYKLKYANIFVAKAEFMVVIGLTLLLVIAYKKDDLEVDVHKTIGWGITFIFAFAWLRMTQLFFVRKLNQLSKKVQPKDGKKENAKKEDAKGNKADAIPAFEDYVKKGDRSSLGGKFVAQDEVSNLRVNKLSDDSSSEEEISNVDESQLSSDSLDIPDQSELSDDSDSDAPKQGGLIGVQEHDAHDKNELKGLKSKIGGTIRVSSR